MKYDPAQRRSETVRVPRRNGFEAAASRSAKLKDIENAAFRHALVNLVRSPFHEINHGLTPSSVGRGASGICIPLFNKFAQTFDLNSGHVLSMILHPWTRVSPYGPPGTFGAGRYQKGPPGTAWSTSVGSGDMIMYEYDPASMGGSYAFLGGGATVRIEKPMDGLCSGRVIDVGDLVGGSILTGLPPAPSINNCGYLHRWNAAAVARPLTIGDTGVSGWAPFVDNAQFIKTGFSTPSLGGQTNPWNYYWAADSDATNMNDMSRGGQIIEVYNTGSTMLRVSIVGGFQLAFRPEDAVQSALMGVKEHTADIPWDLPNLNYLSAHGTGSTLQEADRALEERLRTNIGFDPPESALRADRSCYTVPTGSSGCASIAARSRVASESLNESWFSRIFSAHQSAQSATRAIENVVDVTRFARTAYEMMTNPSAASVSSGTIGWH